MTDDRIVNDISVDLGEIEQESWQEVVDEALARISVSTSSAERVVLRQEIAAIYEGHLADPEGAFAQLMQAFVENPMNQQTVRSLERLADSLSRWPELYACSTAALNATPGKHAQVYLCLKIGDWCAEKLGQLDHAFGYYRSALDRKPDHIKAYLKLAGLYRKTEQWMDLVAVLEAAAANCDEKERAKEFLFERGVIFEQHLEDPDAACKAFEQALVLDPVYMPALDVLDRIYRIHNETWQLVSVLKRKLEAVEDADPRIQLHLRIGAILDGDGGDPEGAAENYRKALKIDPSKLDALEALEGIYQKLDKKTKAKEVLEKRIQYTLYEEDKIALMERFATMLGEGFAEWEKAASVWEQLLELNPLHQRASAELENIYSRRRKWPELAELVKQKLQKSQDEQEQVELCLQLGQIQGKHLEQWDKACISFEQILDTEPDHLGALDGLSNALVATEQWSDAVDRLKQLLELVRESEEEKEVLHRLGTILAGAGEDIPSACDYFQKVLAIDKDHLPAMRALRNAYIAIEQWKEAAELLDYEQSITESRTGKAKLCFELGGLHQKMGDGAQKKQWYEKAIEYDPYHQPTAEALVDLYQQDGRHEEAESLLEMLIRLGSEREESEKRDLYHKLSVTKDALGKTEEHLEAARKAREFGSSSADYETLSDLVRAAIKNEKYHEVVETCRLIAKLNQEKLSGVQKADLFYSFGLAHYKLNNKAKALKHLKAALNTNPAHKDALEIMIELAMKRKSYDDVVKYRNELAGLLEGDERYAAYMELGDLCQQKFGRDVEAVLAFEAAALVKPKDRPALHKLLALYQSEERWTEVIETIEAIVETEEDSIRLSRLYYSMAVVWRDKLDDPPKALDFFNRALDANPEDEETFKAVIAIVARTKDWREIERNYQWMLDRLEGRDNRRFEASLQHSLGEVYLYRIENYPAAALAFEAAVAIDGENLSHHDRLASAYYRMEDHAEEAIAKYRHLISLTPDNSKYYKRLGSLLSSSGRHDEAWCVSSALVFLGQASEQEAQFYERFRPIHHPPAKNRLPAEMWSAALSHPDDSELIAEIFSIVGPAIAEIGVQPLKAYGLGKKDLVSSKSCDDIDKIAHYIAGTLGIPSMPELYIKKDDASSFTPILTKNPASVCGDRFLQGRSRGDLLFLLTKHVAYYRPGRRMRWILPTTGELRAVLGAAAKFGDKSYKLPGTKTQVIFRYVDVLNELLRPEQIKQLKEVAERFSASSESSSVRRWIEGLEHTACRTALLLSGDLAKAVAMVRSERAVASGPTLTSKVLDLQLFSISKEYADLRKAIGIGINMAASANDKG